MSRKSGLRKVNRLRRIFRKLPDEITEETRSAIASATRQIESAAKANVPVDSGELKKRITSKISPDGLTAKIGLRTKTAKRKAFYAHFVEFGTRLIPAKPFLFPAFERNRRPLARQVKRAVRRGIRKAKQQGFNVR